MTIDLANSTATEHLGANLALALELNPARPPLVLYLRGDLGAGKTTLVRGFLRALGWTGTVRSPSYTLLEPYDLASCHCIHVDLYRLHTPAELEDLGLRDYLTPSHVLLIEWPERGGANTPAALLDIQLEFSGEGRRATLSASVEVLQRFEIASLST